MIRFSENGSFNLLKMPDSELDMIADRYRELCKGEEQLVENDTVTSFHVYLLRTRLGGKSETI